MNNSRILVAQRYSIHLGTQYGLSSSSVGPLQALCYYDKEALSVPRRHRVHAAQTQAGNYVFYKSVSVWEIGKESMKGLMGLNRGWT